MAGANRTWTCTVCGYVHRGDEPPDACPVCGAPRELFEPQAETSPPAAKPAANQWRCLVCGYVHTGAQPPNECPACGATADCFEPVSTAAKTTAVAAQSIRAVIVGAGIAGISAAESLRAASPTTEITLVSNEAEFPYYRLNLTRYLAGEIGEQDLPIHAASWYEERKIRLMFGTDVSTIHVDEHVVELHGGEKLPFDRLLLAAGGASVPSADTRRGPGRGDQPADSGGCPPDTDSVPGRGEVRLHRRRSAGIGNGGALARQGADVTLLEGFGWLLPRQLNQRAGEILNQYVVGTGIKLQAKAITREIVGDGRVRGVCLEDGSTVPADLVVIATGIRPNSHLARRAGLEVNQGVVVDNLLRTSHRDVYAAGDVAEHRGQVYGTWGPSQYQGSIAGMNMAGDSVEFGGVPRSNTLKVLGLDLFSIGQFNPQDASFRTFDEEADGRYCRFIFRDNRLVGTVLLGDTKLAATVKRTVESGTDYSGLLANCSAASEIIAAFGWL